MKSLVFISYILLITGLMFAQEYKPYNTFNKEAELQKFVERGGKVEEISPNVYRLTYRTGEIRVFKFSSKENLYEGNNPVDTTVINIWEIDTTKFAGMFTFWQQVQVANISWVPLLIEDSNNNGHPELFGHTDIIGTNLAGPVKIFERNTNGIYQDVFTYDSGTVIAKGIGDIHGTGSKEIFITGIEDGYIFHYPVYRNDSANGLPTLFDFFFYFDTLQINDMVFGDWDKNGIPDCAFTVSLSSVPPACIIAEYRDSINNFEELFRFEILPEAGISGFAIADFDQDGKTEFVLSSGVGDVYVIENQDVNDYALVNQFQFPTSNAYMQTSTNDIDKNGRPEFWIGGMDYSEGITIFQCYESDGDNSYKPVARIELRYLSSLSGTEYIQAVDIDDDGKEEFIISIGNVILILKFVGSPNNHQYQLWYAKLGEATQPGAQFYPATIADLDGDGRKDLLIPMTRYTPGITYALSYILKQNKPSSILESGINEISFETVKSYPNPFNSESTISFNVTESSNVQIKIFNLLGKEINLLLDKELTPGGYKTTWDAKDKSGNPLPSGIYLIVLKTKNSVKTFKSILLK